MFMSGFDEVYAKNPELPEPSISRLTIASILSFDPSERFRKYQEPAKPCVEAPKATKRTGRRNRIELVLTILASSSIIARPDAFPLAPA